MDISFGSIARRPVILSRVPRKAAQSPASGDKRRSAPPPFRKHPLAFESFEPRLLLSGVAIAPGAETAIIDGLNRLAVFADGLQELGEFTDNLPVVNQAIAPVVDFGDKLRDRLLTPVQSWFAANDADTGTLVGHLNGLFGADMFTDQSAGSEIRIQVEPFSQSSTAENLDIDLGEVARLLGLEFGDTKLDMVASFAFGSAFDFGFDLDPAKSPSEAFFVDFTGTTLGFTVSTPFADQASPAALNFSMNVGMLGDVSVTNGLIDLDASVGVAFNDPILTAQALQGSAPADLVALTGSASLAVNLPVSATIGGQNVGSATIEVTLTPSGDPSKPFDDFDIDVDIGGAAAQAFRNFSNITPGDVVSALNELATSLQGMAESFDLPDGIPFVDDAMSDIVDFAGRVQALTEALYDLGLQGGVEILTGALSGNATFDVVIDGVTTSILIGTGVLDPDPATTLTNIVTAINTQLGVGAKVEAVIEDGRLALRAIDETVQALSFANVNDVAAAAFGLASTQTAIPFFDFVSFQDFEDVVDDFLPSAFAIAYDPASQTIGFDLDLFGSVAGGLALDFSKDIDLGGLAILSLAGSGHGDVDAAARLSLEAAFDLTPLTDATLLDDLNGGAGLGTDLGAGADLNFEFADGTVGSVDLDGLTTVGQLRDAINSQTAGRATVAINFTQDGLVLVDTTHTNSTTGTFKVSFAPGSTAVADLGFGIGLSDADDDGRIDGGTIMSRLFLKPYDGDTESGSIVAAGIELSATDLHLGAALGVLQVGVSGGTTAPIELAARGVLVDPNDSDRIYLSELLADPLAAVDVGFGTFAGGTDLSGAFTGFAANDEIGAFDLTLSFDDADTFGIDLGGELATISVRLRVDSVADLVPVLVPDVDVDAGTLPNFSAILESFENLSIPQLLSLVGQIVQQFDQLPLISTPLPLLDQSIGDLVAFVTDKVDELMGDFADMRAHLEALLESTIAGLRDQAAALVLPAGSLADGLAALGPERQDELFHALEGLSGAIQALPADLNLQFDGGSPKLVALAGSFRALRELIADIADDVTSAELPAAAQAVVQFFTTAVAGIPALAQRSFVSGLADLLPSSDRIVKLLMETLGLDLFDLADAANATILAAVTAARDAVDTALDNLPALPSDEDLGNVQPLIDARDAAQVALDGAGVSLGNVFDRLEVAVTDLNVYAAVRAVSYLSDAIDQIRTAIQTLADAADPAFATAITNLQAWLTDIVDDVRGQVFEAFPLGALTFDLPGGDELRVDLHVARQNLVVPVNVEFDLQDAGLPEIVPLNFEGEINGNITLGAEFRFGLGLDIDPGSANFLDPFIDADSFLALTADVNLPINATASIGGFSLSVVDGIVLLRDAIDLGLDNAVGGSGDDADDYGGPARLGLSLADPTPGDGRIYFSELLSAVDPQLQATLLVNLPVEANGTSFGSIYAFASVNDFDDFDFTIEGLDPDLVQEIINGLTELNLANILAGLRTLLDTLSNAMTSDLLAEIPGIGDDLASVGNVLGDVNGFLTEFETFINGTLGGLTAEAMLDQLKMFVFDTLGPGAVAGDAADLLPAFSALKILSLDPTAGEDSLDGVVDWTDLPISFSGADITAANALQLADAGFEFALQVGFDKTIEVPLDFGFEGMGLSLESDTVLDLRIAPELGLAFGLSRTSGFYVDLDQTGGSLKVDAYLDPNSSLDLNLWFMQLSASAAPVEDFNHDGDATDTGLDETADNIDYNRDGTIGGVVNEPGDGDANGEITGGVGIFGTAALSFGTGKLTFNNLEDIAPDFSFDAKADLDIIFSASLAGSQDLPSLEALLDLDWNFSLDNPVAPDVRFANVRLDLGDFFRDNIAPVIDTFSDYLEPLQVIFDVVNTEIPVISDLAVLLGQDPVTFLDLVGLLGSGFEDVADFVATLDGIIEIIDTLEFIADTVDSLASGFIEFGDLTLPAGVDVTDRGARSAIQTFDDASALTATAADIIGQFGAAADKFDDLKTGSTGSSSSNVGVTGGQFHFPVIDDPFGTVAGFLLGQTRDLVVWDLPDFVAEFSFKQLFGPIFPPIPLYVSIFGSFEFSTDFAIGFDTRGIQQSAADFYKGFYLRDWEAGDDGILGDGETTEARELGLDMEFGAGAELNVVVASAGVEGGVAAAITADWNDVLEDGKFYVDEVGQRLEQGLQCLFDLAGQLDAFLRAFVKIGFDTPFGFVTLFEESLELVRVTLLDFSLSCPPLPIPQPGSDLDLANDSDIHLNIGPRAGFRQPGATDVAETVEIFGERDTDGDAATRLALNAGLGDGDSDGDIDSDDVDIWVAGGGVLSATIDLNGDNKLDVDEARRLEDFNNSGTLGTSEDDRQSIMLIGFGQWQIFRNTATGIVGDGGLDDDRIILDHSVQIPSNLKGGAGNDEIRGGQAGDTIRGDGDNEAASDGEDILIGGFGNDTIYGGGLNDQIFGNAGSDTIHGGTGNDTIAGDDGNNVQPVFLDLQGEPIAPESLVPLAQLADTIHGGDGEDNMMGEYGNDVIYGNAGPDQLVGGYGDDYLYGGADPDLLEGNAGSDHLYGESGNDLLFGEADGVSTAEDGDDWLDGGTENDTIRDDRGNDTLIGGFGDDAIYAGIGNDVIFGDLDPRAGGAPPAGYNGMDTIYADRDALPAVDDGFGLGNGDDYVEGGGNADTIYAGAGNDRIIGGGSPFSGTTFGGTDGADRIFGQDGDDIIAGDNAVIGLVGNVASAATVVTYPQGGAGADQIKGGAGADWIFGGGEGDTLYGDDAGGAFDDIVVGDQGTLGATKVEALHDATGGSAGSDTIYGYGGADILLGGDLGDMIAGNLGNDFLVGDNGTVTGSFTPAAASVVRVATRDPQHGGNDTIYGDAGADIAFGGFGDDYISGGSDLSGDLGDILFGDNGVAVLLDDSADENDLFSTDPTWGGEDTIFGGLGNDIIVGGSGGNDATGLGGDSLFGQSGDDIVLGDNGRVNRSDDTSSPEILRIFSTFTGDGAAASGGDDALWGGIGRDVLIGGFGADEAHGQAGDDILLGDSGEVIFDAEPVDDPSTLDEIRSTALAFGGIDLLTGDAGADIAMGGTAGDFVHGDDATASNAGTDGEDILLGDNGEILLVDPADYTDDPGYLGLDVGEIVVLGGAVATIRTTDTVAATGGIDFVEGNAGGDILLGGVAGDALYGDALVKGAHDGDDIVLGDNGRLEWLYAGDAAFAAIEDLLPQDRNGAAAGKFDGAVSTLDLITTELPASHLGGRDTIYGDEGRDRLFGGEDSDTVHGDDGNGTGSADNEDVIFGDHGRIYPQHSRIAPTVSDPGLPSINYFAIDTGDGANGEGDWLYGEEGADAMLGQQGDDVMFGGSGDDAMIGGHNVAGGVDELLVPDISAQLNPPVNDLMDGGSGNDAMAGDNATIWWQAVETSPRFRTLEAGASTVYSTTEDTILVNEDGTQRGDPFSDVGWDITLLDHAFDTSASLYGSDVMAGGADRDTMFGQLGNDLMQGDGSLVDGGLAPATAQGTIVVSDGGAPVKTYHFDVPEAASDSDDYMEGNGGADTMFGGLGQDDVIGGSSALYGLTSAGMRPDGSDTIFGGAGIRIGRNDVGDPASLGHARDADQIVGDNANVYRFLASDGETPLVYAYDNYGGATRLVVRGVDQLDYTLGGPDYVGASPNALGQAPGDNGTGDFIWGEDGDDSIFAMTGSDVVYGGAQDDDIIGGYGHDWVSGGSGQDGVVGDDGLIYTSRNGTAESLYGIAATSQQTISTPGRIQLAIIDPTGELKKTADLTPLSVDPSWLGDDDEFPDNEDGIPFADDIIYGGLGSDFLHGGSGDDAISGAEALPDFYAAPLNPGDVLGFAVEDSDGEHLNNRYRAGEFAAYDEYFPLLRIEDFLLNFDPTEGEAQGGGIFSDGNDAIFGDLGNDWAVGGTGRDNLYGGWGNDLLNADDDHGTNGGANDVPDGPVASYEDRAYGGAGRDVLIGNTGGDRLIDWVGEYNSYLVPFAPFGMSTVSRTLQPQLAEFLYALSRADGADPTIVADGSGEAIRNGEPYGELGLVLQKDPAWQDQTGAPSDPQAGNIPGGKRDVLRSADFSSQQAQGFVPDSGTWQINGGRYQVAPSAIGGDAVSVWSLDVAVPSYFEISATINPLKPVAGYKANAYIVFDYWGPDDFKYAGLNVSTNKLEIGQRTADGWQVLSSSNLTLRSGADVNVLLALNGTTATIVINNQHSLSHAFTPRVDEYGITHGFNDGLFGLGAQNAKATIDNVKLQVIPPTITWTATESFDTAPQMLQAEAGAWSLSGGRWAAAPTAAQPIAIATGDLRIGANNVLQLETVLRTGAQGGLVFDVYSPDDFKWVALSDTSNQVLIGHYTARDGWVVDAAVGIPVASGNDYTLGALLKGSTVSVTLDGGVVLGHAFNSIVTDGAFGLMARGGEASFDSFRVQTDDPSLAAAGGTTLALEAVSEGDGAQAAVLDASALAATADAAIDDWRAAAFGSSLDQAVLDGIVFRIEDLGGTTLARYESGVIVVDDDAAGHGWFVDDSPEDDREFRPAGSDLLVSRESSDANGKIDLLTVLRHEVGHALGYAHDDGLMAETLETGVRRAAGDSVPAPSAALPEQVPMQALVGFGASEAENGLADTVIDWTRWLGSETAQAKRAAAKAGWRGDLAASLGAHSPGSPNAMMRITL